MNIMIRVLCGSLLFITSACACFVTRPELGSVVRGVALAESVARGVVVGGLTSLGAHGYMRYASEPSPLIANLMRNAISYGLQTAHVLEKLNLTYAEQLSPVVGVRALSWKESMGCSFIGSYFADAIINRSLKKRAVQPASLTQKTNSLQGGIAVIPGKLANAKETSTPAAVHDRLSRVWDETSGS